MDQKQDQSSRSDDLTRRKFMRNSTVAVAGLAAGLGVAGCESMRFGKAEKPRSYSPEMEYRRLGGTGPWVSAVCMGGHWKRLDKAISLQSKGVRGWTGIHLSDPAFQKNRYEVISRCIESGINYIDACSPAEILAYAEALRGRRDKIYFGFSWSTGEMRSANYRTAKALLKTLDKGLCEAKLDYVDLWRPTMHEQSSRHTSAEVDEMMGALEKARKQGKCRLCGFSSHDRSHIKWMIETYPDIVDAVVTPYTARSKVKPKDSLFDALKKYDVGCFGIKPFASNSLFKGDSSLNSPHAKQDDQLARLAIRYILATDVITAPIPGLINTHQVDNVAKAVKERRQLDLAEAKELEEAMDQAWARLPADYQWLKNWEYV